MRFSIAAPGALTPAGGGVYVGEWSVHASNFGHTSSEVASWVASALNDASGWGRVDGLSFNDVGLGGGGVTFRTVETLPGLAIGMCYYDTSPPRVELVASWFGNLDLVNHEAAHAFFFATHSPEGSVSIMEPIEDPGEEWPSDTDIEQVAAWLAEDPEADTGGLMPGLYWHPADSDGYKTKWDLTGASGVRISVPVTQAITKGAEDAATLSAVYSTDKDAPIADWLPLGASLGISGPGMLDSGWRDIASEATTDVYVAMTLDVALPLHTFVPGAAEIRVR